MEYRLIDFSVTEDGKIRGRFSVSLSEGGTPTEQVVIAPKGASGAEYMKKAGRILFSRLLPPSKLEQDLEQAVSEEHIYEVLDPSKDAARVIYEDEPEGTEQQD